MREFATTTFVVDGTNGTTENGVTVTDRSNGLSASMPFVAAVSRDESCGTIHLPTANAKIGDGEVSALTPPSVKKSLIKDQFGSFVNNSVFRYFKYWNDVEDRTPDGQLGTFVKTEYWVGMKVNADVGDCTFEEWWGHSWKTLRSRLSIKRSNQVAAVRRVFKCKYRKGGLFIVMWVE